MGSSLPPLMRMTASFVAAPAVTLNGLLVLSGNPLAEATSV